MNVGVADYGLNVWDGGCTDLAARLSALLAIGYAGVERLEAQSDAEALERAAIFRRLGAAFSTCRGPSFDSSLRWTAALRGQYLWVTSPARDLETLCRHARRQASAAAEWGLRVGLHNHLGTPVETHEDLDTFMSNCPECGLILDTAHLAASGGDPLAAVGRYADRLVAVHFKDWVVTDPSVGLGDWSRRGRFCALGRGNVGLDNRSIVREILRHGVSVPLFVEQDTHLRDPFVDLTESRAYLRDAGI